MNYQLCWEDFVVRAACIVATAVATAVVAAVGIGVIVTATTARNRVAVGASGTADCRPHDLGLTYEGGGPGAGNDFGTIVIRDVQMLRCQLVGPIVVVGTTRGGRAVTTSVSYTVPAGLVLSAAAPPVPAGGAPPVGEDVAQLVVSAEYRDGPFPPSYLCKGHYVIPARWSLTLPGGVVNVVNASRGDMYRGFGSLVTCEGRLNLASGVDALSRIQGTT